MKCSETKLGNPSVANQKIRKQSESLLGVSAESRTDHDESKEPELRAGQKSRVIALINRAAGYPTAKAPLC